MFRPTTVQDGRRRRPRRLDEPGVGHSPPDQRAGEARQSAGRRDPEHSAATDPWHAALEVQSAGHVCGDPHRRRAAECRAHGITGRTLCAGAWRPRRLDSQGGVAALNNGSVLGESHVTLAELMRAAYRKTAGFVSLGVLRKRFGVSQGFDQYHDHFAGNWWKSAEEMNRIILPWLEAQSSSPFFLWANGPNGVP